jgi:type I restriction-modification system DNA methylase subunit
MSTVAKGIEIIQQKVADFYANEATYTSKQFSEAEVRSRFIDPFFMALGWDLEQTDKPRHLWDVHREYSQRDNSTTKKPDYAFRLDRRLKFFVEAKAPSVSLQDKDPVFQAKRYAYSTNGLAPIVILTDFEEFCVFNALERPIYENPFQGLLPQFKLKYTDYVSMWELIRGTFSREAVASGSIDSLRAMISRNTKTLDEDFLSEITEWRELLARNIASRNGNLNVDDLNEAVQRILDRLVFIRNLEDRGIEPENLLLNISKQSSDVYSQLMSIFARLNGDYNGLLFKPHFSEKLALDDELLRKIIQSMCPPRSPFQFGVIHVEILGRIYERFLGSKIRLTQNHHAKIDEKPEVRHAGGVYYTPQFIVDQIIDMTLSSAIHKLPPEDLSEYRILDPACGSGSFLIGALTSLEEHLCNWYSTHRKNRRYSRDFFVNNDGELQLTVDRKRMLLTDCLFGVDIDREATEVAIMSLYLKLLDKGFDKGQALLLLKGHVLPDLTSNIRFGNSLIASDYFSGKDVSNVSDESYKRVSAFDWESNFPFLANGSKFDCIVGNPPYLAFHEAKSDVRDYLREKYTSATGKYDQYLLFIERSLSLLAEGGRLGFIIPNKFIHSHYGVGIKKVILEKKIIEIIDFNDIPVFKGATNYPCILVIENSKPPSGYSFEYNTVVEIADNKIHTSTTKIIQSSLGHASWMVAGAEESDVIAKIKSMPLRLADISRYITQGLRTGHLDAYFNSINAEVIEHEKLEPQLIRTVFHGKNVKRFHNLIDRKFDRIIFPYQEDSQTPVDLARYPNIERHLLEYKRELLERRDSGKVFKDTGKPWYAYWDPKPVCFSSPKIVFPDISDRCNFYLDREGMGYLNTCYAVFLKQPRFYDFILGLLNSIVVEFFITKTTPFVRGGYYRFKTKFLEAIPIPSLSQIGETTIDDLSVVSKMLQDSYSTLMITQNVKDRQTVTQKIEITERRLNDLVTTVYGLSASDIRTIHSSLKLQ